MEILENKKFMKIKVLIFITLSVCIYTYNLFVVDSIPVELEVKNLGVLDAYLMFGVNFFSVNMLVLYSFIGLSIPMIIIFLGTMTSAGIRSGLPLNYYYLSSYSHGVLELVVYLIIFSLAVDLLFGYVISLKKNNLEVVEKRAKKFLSMNTLS